MVWYSHLFKNFPVCGDHTVKGFGIVNKAEVDIFLEFSCSFDNPTDVGGLISGFSAFSQTRLNIWKFTVHVLLKPGLENFEHYFTDMWLKRLPGMLETRVPSLGREDSLEKEMATQSSILAWRIPWREEPGRLQSMGSQRVQYD